MDAETKRRVDEMWPQLGISWRNGGTAERRNGGRRRAGADRERAFRRSAVPPSAPEGQTFAGESLLVRYVNFVKLPHTLFALPFALLGVLAASLTSAVTLRAVALVVIAFSAARWAAMGFNRIADRAFDARNPRTMQRELPRGAHHARRRRGSSVHRGRGDLHARRRLAQPALPAAEPARARLDPDLQPDQAVHLVAAPLARPRAWRSRRSAAISR